MARRFHLIALVLLATGPVFAQRSLPQSNAADTTLLIQLATDLRASMGSDRFHGFVDSLGTLARRLALSPDGAVRKAAAEGKAQYHRFAAWDACFRSTYAAAVHHADTVDLLLGGRRDRLALTIKRSSNRARMSVCDVLSDTAQWYALHVEDLSLSRALGDTLALLDAFTMSVGNTPSQQEVGSGEVLTRACIEHGSDSVAMRARWYLGRLLWGTGRQAEALPHVLASRSFALDGTKNAWMPPMYHVGVGYCYHETGRTDLALQHYDSCMLVASQGGIPTWYCACALDKAEVLQGLGDHAGTFALYRSAFDTAQAYGLVRHVASDGKLLADQLRRMGRWREALEVSDAYHAAQDSLNNSASGRALAAAVFLGQQRADSVAHAAELAVQAAEVRRQRVLRNSALGGSALLGMCAVIFLFQRVRISKEKKRSDELLLNILPAEVAEELKSTGTSEARHIEHATILFTDFKGFTEASEQLTPQQLVEELDTCFKAFDAIITTRGIEKIKTIGDAYMAAGGLRKQAPNGVAEVVHAALDMQAFMLQRKIERTAQGKPAFDMRVGIHTGPVVAGIVGVKKFQYDIWGDTVNTASRMESSGEVGKVNISTSTHHELVVQSGWHFTPRGLVSAKGKGQLTMFFVERN